MGCDCIITLPPRVRSYDVSKVVAIAGGAPKKLEGKHDSIFLQVERKLEPSSVASCSEITFVNLFGEHSHVLYHYEFGDGNRGMMPRSTAFWIAIGRKVVKLFGGHLYYNDCAENEKPDEFYQSSYWINSKDGEDWVKLQKAMFAIQPITKEEYEDAAKFAAYEFPWREVSNLV